MIPGRFNQRFSSFNFPQSKVSRALGNIYTKLFYPSRRIFMGKYLFSDFRVHLHDLFIRTRDLNPFDDSKNRYVVIQHRFDENNKRMVIIRTGASSTLKGAMRKVKRQSEITGLEYLGNQIKDIEYISIFYFRVNYDVERAISRRMFKGKYVRNMGDDQKQAE